MVCMYIRRSGTGRQGGAQADRQAGHRRQGRISLGMVAVVESAYHICRSRT